MRAIALTAVASSQIAAIGYDPDSQTLAVQFIETGAEGRLYHYLNFPPEKFAELEAAESKGSYFYKRIKNRYTFERYEADGTCSKVGEATLSPEDGQAGEQPTDPAPAPAEDAVGTDQGADAANEAGAPDNEPQAA